MEDAFRALRRHAVGSGREAAVLQAASGVVKALLTAEGAALLAEIAAATGGAASTADDASSEASGAAPPSHGLRSPLLAGASSPPSGLQASPLMSPFAGSPAGVPLLEADGEQIAEFCTWGQSKNFQLGFACAGDEQPVPRLVTFTGNAKVKMVSCGHLHTVAVMTCGSVNCWGFGGTTGRLGVGPLAGGTAVPTCLVEPTSLPEFGPRRHVAVKAAAGGSHTFVLTAAGKVVTWGLNNRGQTGVPGGPMGEGAQVLRPTVLKTAFRNEEVKDVAAGFEHSLCVAGKAGSVWTWGSGSRGQLGLGPPPAGPHETSQPQQLPHLKGALSVAAPASGHVSIVLASHGDAVIFGGSAVVASSQGSAAGRATPDPKFFVPIRVRRREGTGGRGRALSGTIGGADAEEEEWQTCRGGSASTSPLRCVAFTTEEVLAVDSFGTLWTWHMQAPRPCFAEAQDVVTIAANPKSSPQMAPQGSTLAEERAPSFGFSSLAVADKVDTIWAIDRSACSCLWRLRRPAGSDGSWYAERHEQLAQVVFITCGPQHHSACIAYRRPHEVLPPTLGSLAEDSDDEGEAMPAQTPQRLGDGDRVTVPSLQQLCEDRLCRSIAPQNFGLVCEVAWDLQRPHLLDRAFAFLRANAALMFSKSYLPALTQLPLEVLAAFELSCRGDLPSPSAALDLEQPDARDAVYTLMASDWESAPALDNPTFALPDAVSAATASVDDSSKGGQKKPRKKRQVPEGGSPKAVVPGLEEVSVKTGAMGTTQGASPAHTPGMGPVPSSALPSSSAAPWTKVVRGPRAKQLPSCSSGLLGVSQALSRPGPKPVVTNGGPGNLARSSASTAPPPPAQQGATGKASPPVPQYTQTADLADFLAKGRKSSGSIASTTRGSGDSTGAQDDGPSAMLAAALAACKANGWGRGEATDDGSESATKAKPAETATPSLRQILEEDGSAAKERQRASTGGSRGSADVEATRNSWGFDCMPSERPKGPSVYQVQEEEQKEKAKQKEDAEIRDIEAMFEALAVAEQEEERERLGLTNGGAASSSSAMARPAKPAKERAQGAKAKQSGSASGTLAGRGVDNSGKQPARKRAGGESLGSGDGGENNGRAGGRSGGGGGRGKGGGKNGGKAGSRGGQGRGRERASTWSNWWSWSSGGWSWDSWWSTEDDAGRVASESGPTVADADLVEGSGHSWEAVRQGSDAVDGNKTAAEVNQD